MSFALGGVVSSVMKNRNTRFEVDEVRTLKKKLNTKNRQKIAKFHKYAFSDCRTK